MIVNLLINGRSILKNPNNKPCYKLTPAQGVAYFQCKFSFYKRVINIIASITLSEKVDYATLNKAYKLLVKRNDALRIKFFKKKGQLMQYFENYDAKKVKDIPEFSFATEKEQDKFINKLRNCHIKFMNGVVIEPYFIHTFDGRDMIFFKVCHLALDIYGLKNIFTDLLDLYNALKNGTELPAPMAKYEDVVKKDLDGIDNQAAYNKHVDFFTDMLYNNPEPYYAGIHGPKNKTWKKQLAKHRRCMPLLIFNNRTKTYTHKIDRRTTERIIFYCRHNQCSPANLLFYTCSLTQAILNGKLKNLLPVGLYDCRVTAAEKRCGGSKAQSAGCYTKINYSQTFEENLRAFSGDQLKLYRHVKFPDIDFETMVHNAYRTSPLDMYYAVAYSLIYFDIPEGVELNVYSNGRVALPAYIVQFLNSKTNEIEMAYDVQTKTTSEEDVLVFHSYYLNVLNQVLDDPHIVTGDIVLSPNEFTK